MTRFYNTLAVLAVILTPVAMMAAFGWTVYAEILTLTNAPWLAVLSGLATAAALECIGIVAGETALWFHARGDRRWLAAASILAVYVLAGLVMLRATPLALLPVLAGAVYVLIGLRAQAARETAAANGHADAAAAWERERWRIQQEDRTRVKLAQVQAALLAESSSPASNMLVLAHDASSLLYECQHCRQTFSSPQALGGHVKAAHRTIQQEAHQ